MYTLIVFHVGTFDIAAAQQFKSFEKAYAKQEWIHDHFPDVQAMVLDTGAEAVATALDQAASRRMTDPVLPLYDEEGDA